MLSYTWLIYASDLSLLTVSWSSVKVGNKKFTEGHRKVGRYQKCSSNVIRKHFKLYIIKRNMYFMHILNDHLQTSQLVNHTVTRACEGNDESSNPLFIHSFNSHL
jgi:hypothetical protein